MFYISQCNLDVFPSLKASHVLLTLDCMLRYGKGGNKKRATCFATLLQNKLNSVVTHFTTHIKPVSNRWMVIKIRNIVIQVLLKQNCKTSYTLMWKWINQHVISGSWEIIGSNPVRGLRFFLCSTLLTSWLIHFHICFTTLKIYHLSFFHYTIWHRHRLSLQYAASVLIWA